MMLFHLDVTKIGWAKGIWEKSKNYGLCVDWDEIGRKSKQKMEK